MVYCRQICSTGNIPRVDCKFKNLLDSELLFLVESVPLTTKTDCVKIMIFKKYNPWVIKPFPLPVDKASCHETCLWYLIVWPVLIMYDDTHGLK